MFPSSLVSTFVTRTGFFALCLYTLTPPIITLPDENLMLLERTETVKSYPPFMRFVNAASSITKVAVVHLWLVERYTHFVSLSALSRESYIMLKTDLSASR